MLDHKSPAWRLPNRAIMRKIGSCSGVGTSSEKPAIHLAATRRYYCRESGEKANTHSIYITYYAFIV